MEQKYQRETADLQLALDEARDGHEIQRDAHEGEVQSLKKQLDKYKQEADSDVAQERSKSVEEVKSLQQNHREEVRRLEEDMRQEYAAKIDRLEAKILKLKKKHSEELHAEVTAEKRRNEKTLKEMEDRHETKVADMQDRHEEERQNLREKQRKMLDTREDMAT